MKDPFLFVPLPAALGKMPRQATALTRATLTTAVQDPIRLRTHHEADPPITSVLASEVPPSQVADRIPVFSDLLLHSQLLSHHCWGQRGL